ncbi:unnamed protein product [Trichobilharzia szidati]|nr:unnamed protein product [Trichobilharzia szidati]
MAYDMPYSNRESGRDYRNGSRHVEHPYENSGSRKRYRDAPQTSFENDVKDRERIPRSKDNPVKYRSDSRYDRYADASPVARKRSKMDVRGDASPPKPSRILGAFGLSMRTEERDLYDAMKKYGDIEEVKIVQDNISGRSRGFAFIYFRSMESARAARAACARGLELHGRIVRIDYSFTKGPHNPTPGIYMGKEKRLSYGGPGRRPMFDERRRSPMYETRVPRPRSSQRIPRPPPMEKPSRYDQSPTAAEETSRSRDSLAYNSSSRSRNPRNGDSVHQSHSRPSRPVVMRNSYNMRRQGGRNEFPSINNSFSSN